MKKLITFFFTIAIWANTTAQSGIISTYAGNGFGAGSGTGGYSGDGGAATSAELNNPQGIAVDATGNLYIADKGNHRIRKVNTSGIISTIAGTGTGGYSGDGGSATLAQLYNPSGLAIDASGNLYISDYNNERIRKINASGIISTIAGNGTAGYTGDGGAATSAAIKAPSWITVDASGNVFFCDENNYVIRKINTSGIISTVAGNGVYGVSGNGGPATSAEFHDPDGIAADAAGNLYISDFGNTIIRKVNTSGIINPIVGTGTYGFSGDGGQALSATMHFSYGVFVDGSGNMFFGDQYRVRKVNTSGIINTIAGTSVQGYTGDGGQATSAELSDPVAFALDPSGNLYVCDKGNHVIRKIAFSSEIEKFSENVKMIYPNPTSGKFTIELTGTTKQTVNVYDVNGKVVLSQTINGTTTIDANKLNEGVYNISITSSEGVVNKRLIIVR